MICQYAIKLGFDRFHDQPPAITSLASQQIQLQYKTNCYNDVEAGWAC